MERYVAQVPPTAKSAAKYWPQFIYLFKIPEHKF
jgi:hypothetical protein